MKTDTLPLVSIITVSYNSAATISDTLQSVAIQSYPAIEHIIIDGLSNDDTLTIVKEFPHVATLISEKDKGIYDAMNKGIARSTGEIIGILNSDDFYSHPHVIGEVVRQMTETQTEALYGDLVYVHAQQTDKIMRTWVAGIYRKHKFLFGWMPPHPTFFVKRKAYLEWGTFNTALRSAADYELMLRFIYKNQISVSYLPQIIIKMRVGGLSNASLRNRLQANKEDQLAWQLNQIRPYFFTTWLKPVRKIMQFIHRPRISL